MQEKIWLNLVKEARQSFISIEHNKNCGKIPKQKKCYSSQTFHTKKNAKKIKISTFVQTTNKGVPVGNQSLSQARLFFFAWMIQCCPFLAPYKGHLDKLFLKDNWHGSCRQMLVPGFSFARTRWKGSGAEPLTKTSSIECRVHGPKPRRKEFNSWPNRATNGTVHGPSPLCPWHAKDQVKCGGHVSWIRRVTCTAP